MYLKIIVIFLIFVFSNHLKSENELLKVKIDVKLSESNIVNTKSVGEDEILSGAFHGKTESIEDKNFFVLHNPNTINQLFLLLIHSYTSNQPI